MGIKYVGVKRKGHGLDGAYAGTVCGRIYGCHARHDAFGCIPSILPLYHALWPAKVCTVCKGSVGSQWRRKDSGTDCRRRTGGDGELDEGAGSGNADGTIIMEGGYKALNRDEVLKILKDSL